MNISAELLRDRSKENILEIVKYIGKDPERFKVLVELVLGNDEPVLKARASWLLNYCAEPNPGIIIPHLPALINNLNNVLDETTRRNTIRILQFVEIPRALLGKVAAHCFSAMEDKTEPVAIQVFAMSVLASIASREPGIKDELAAIIRELMPYAKPAFLSRGRKILVLLSKLPATQD